MAPITFGGAGRGSSDAGSPVQPLRLAGTQLPRIINPTVPGTSTWTTVITGDTSRTLLVFLPSTANYRITFDTSQSPTAGGILIATTSGGFEMGLQTYGEIVGREWFAASAAGVTLTVITNSQLFDSQQIQVVPTIDQQQEKPKCRLRVPLSTHRRMFSRKLRGSIPNARL